MKKVDFIVIEACDVIDRDTKEGEMAWHELTHHHCIPYVKDGLWSLDEFWLGYSSDPWENRRLAHEDIDEARARPDYVAEQDRSRRDDDCWGMLPIVIGDYIHSKDPEFQDWKSVLLHVTW